jgi:predicted small secreted protein
MNREIRKVRSMILVVALSLSTLTAACGTLVGAGVGAAGGAAVGAATGHDPGKSALIGAGIGALGGAIYDITR